MSRHSLSGGGESRIQTRAAQGRSPPRGAFGHKAARVYLAVVFIADCLGIFRQRTFAGSEAESLEAWGGG